MSVLTPGIWLVVPYLDVVHKQSVRRRITTLPSQTLTTKDGKSLTVGGTLGFEIGDLLRLYNTLEHVDGTLTNMAASAIADTVLGSHTDELRPDKLGRDVTARLDFAQYGLQNVTVEMTDFVVARTLRILQDQRWAMGENMTMSPRA